MVSATGFQREAGSAVPSKFSVKSIVFNATAWPPSRSVRIWRQLPSLTPLMMKCLIVGLIARGAMLARDWLSSAVVQYASRGF